MWNSTRRNFMCSETKTEKVAKEGGLNEGLGWGLFNSSLSFDLLVIGWLPSYLSGCG
nr:hypothetical protein KV8917_410005 [Klebsiella variicola]